MIIIPDTSVIVSGRISELLKKPEYKRARVVIPEVVMAEIENQANQGRESGWSGLDEIITLRNLADGNNIELDFYGVRPKEDEFTNNDDTIRNTAKELGGTLLTGDRIQALVAQAKGIDVIFLAGEKISRELQILKFFDDMTMSVHLREKVVPMVKRGMPGNFELEKLGERPSTRKEISKIAKEIVDFAKVDTDSFMEIERKGATVVQMGPIRIAIARPPFSDGYEITAVRAISKVTLDDYKLSERLIDRLENRAEGVLIAGPPGAGKSTFAQALAEFYKNKNKIVKTMESPRDLLVSDDISQYAPLEGDMEKTSDILLLVRPDYTIYDEVRKTADFKIFADMRLAGVGMAGVMHATKAIDAVQRLIGRVELGMIPQITDTVIFIKDAKLAKVYYLTFNVKVPSGMQEADLARPVIEVLDFETGNAEFEIYTFGDQTVVMPITDIKGGPMGIERLGVDMIIQEFKKYAPAGEIQVDVKGNKANIWVRDEYLSSIIGKGGKNIERLEKKLGLRINLLATDEEAYAPSKPKKKRKMGKRKKRR